MVGNENKRLVSTIFGAAFIANRCMDRQSSQGSKTNGHKSSKIKSTAEHGKFWPDLFHLRLIIVRIHQQRAKLPGL